ncbi:MAG: preprotein translocase subunit SecG, partial [Candidatus Latescibacteria bacterium]|nr:preprotein translocase subunit SecG [Candidatus Latescibacterota bacterium]
MHALLVLLHVIISLSLILVVLLQSSKGGGLAGALG